jgi:Thiol-disulfide isomerase and thioredoxins
MAKASKTKKEVEAVYEEKKIIESPVKGGMSEATKGMIVGMVITALIALVVILLILGKNEGTDKNSTKTKLDPSTYSEGMKEFYEYFESEELTLIIFASSQCSFCVAQKPIVENIAKDYDIKYLYMDYLELASQAEVDKVVEELKLEKGSTPTSVVVKNGEVVKTWVGYADGKEYVANLISAGMLKSGNTYKQEDNLTAIDYKKFKDLLNGSKVSAVIFDAANCTETCISEREFLNGIAKSNNIPVYHLTATTFSQADQTEFIDKLGEWGYDTAEYKNDKSVKIPLLLFVKDGKIVEYYVGFEKEADITDLFKKVGLIKK